MTTTRLLMGGRPWPLGATATPEGVNFAVASDVADCIEIDIFDSTGQRLMHRWRLGQCLDGVFYGLLPGAGIGTVYGLRAHGPWQAQGPVKLNPSKLLLDPWAKEVVGQVHWHPHLNDASSDAPCDRDTAAYCPKARVAAPLPDIRWSDDAGPPPWRRPAAQSVIYELHVKGLTQLHPDLPPDVRGTFAGLAHPAVTQHLRRMGVTTLCVLPVAWGVDEPFLQAQGKPNYWGYNPLAMQALSPRLSSHPMDPSATRTEFRHMVSALHEAGLEVLLDVVFNHTAEGGEGGATLSMRGLDPQAWYVHDHHGHICNFSGCGNTLNVAHPRVTQFVLDTMRHWVTQYGVDGFRFDLATALGRGPRGFSQEAAFFTALRQDPQLRHIKLVAEPWDIGPEGYQLGNFPGRFLEWNDRYRDALRRYWMGGCGRGEWALRASGSADVFRRPGRAATASVNYLAAHDGFTVLDMLSYSQKHNEANGENNRDGRNGEPSVNCGTEGPSDDPQVIQRRARLQRALLASLLLSRGTPMLRGGDELSQTQGGNNNAYCQDNAITWLDWPHADTDLARFVARCTALRARFGRLYTGEWIDQPALQWLGPQGHLLADDDWHDPTQRTLALLHTPSSPEPALWVGFNPGDETCTFSLPEGQWILELDSADSLEPLTLVNQQVTLAACSVVALTIDPTLRS